MLIPPVKPMTPSTTTILRWFRKSKRLRMRENVTRLKSAKRTPASRSSFRNLRVMALDPTSSSKRRTSTPSFAFAASARPMRVPTSPESKM